MPDLSVYISNRLHRGWLLLAVLWMPALFAAAPVAAISASPVSGFAPLGVFFDGTASLNATTYAWDFGDGGAATGPASTTSTITHIYTVAGTYFATLVVYDSTGAASAPTQITITVSGSGQGPVTAGLNFRIAPFRSSFTVNRVVPNADKLSMHATFNTVDLPIRLAGLAVSVSINNSFTITDHVRVDNTVQNPENLSRPSYFILFDPRNQLIDIEISKANLATALASTGAVDSTISPAVKIPLTITLTIGAESYAFTQLFDYTAVKGVSGTGTFSLTKKAGNIGQGFFVVSSGSAIEVPNAKAHFFQFTGFISPSANVQLQLPPVGGTVSVTLNKAQPAVIPFDRFTQSGKNGLIFYTQTQRVLGGLRSLSIDPLGRFFSLTTWDVYSNPLIGGSGLPVRGESFTIFDFTLRLDISQPGGTTFSVVTATQLQRKTTDDAFWQTGRKKKPQ